MLISYILIELIFGVAYVIGLFIYIPVIYPFRKLIRWSNFTPLWWFLNDSEPDGISDDYGAEWWRILNGYTEPINSYSWFKKLWISYRWSAIRNSHWNLKKALVPKVGAKINIVYKKDTIKTLTWFTMPKEGESPILGVQNVTFEIDGTKYFRYSYTKIRKSNYIHFKELSLYGIKIPCKITKEDFLYNVQYGASDDRYIFKRRKRKL